MIRSAQRQSPPATTSTREYGAVFTKRWVVDMMLDLCGYTVDQDLAHRVAHEPSVGDGAFLLPMVERLAESAECHGIPPRELRSALRAWDLQQQHVEETRKAVRAFLVGRGWCPRTAGTLTRAWIQHGDYLLESAEPGPLLRDPDTHTADFVIGNPPYIRAEAIPRDLRSRYLSSCSTMTAGSDVFVGFIERGLKSLADDGVLCFICADRWMHNAYGRKLRSLVAAGYSVETVLKMHGVDAFAAEVSAYPAVTLIRRSPQSRVLYAEARPEFDRAAAERFLRWTTRPSRPMSNKDCAAARLPTWFAGGDLWPSGSPRRLRLLEDLESRFPPLENPDTGTRVGIGVATGADRVFITSDPTVAEEERLLPLAKSAHIRTGSLEWADTWLVNPWDDHGRLVDLADWPKLRAYFEQEGESLRRRHIARKHEQAWFRTIDKVHSALTAKPKLLFQDMKRTSDPVLDHGAYYPHHNLYWITSDAWDLRVLGGLLLSRVGQMFIEAYAVRMRGGTLRFQAQYLRTIRVPDPDALPARVAARLSKAFDRRDADAATSAAFEAYRISPSQWKR